MDEKYIEYVIYVYNFILFKPIKYKPNSKHINEVVISTFKNTSLETDPTFPSYHEKLIHFTLNNIKTEEEAKQLVKNELENILNLIAFNVDYVSVKGAYFKDCNLQKDNQKKVTEITLIQTDHKGDIKVANKLSELSTYNNHYFSLYRLATQSSDEIAKFILLYSILAQLEGPYQNKIDKYIKRKESNIRSYRSEKPKKKGKKETKKETAYTFYRNKIAHMSSSSSIIDIREEVYELEKNFEKIVKDAIREKLITKFNKKS